MNPAEGSFKVANAQYYQAEKEFISSGRPRKKRKGMEKGQSAPN